MVGDEGLRAAPLTPEERDYLRGLIEAAPRMDEGSRQVFYRLISYALADAATPTPPEIEKDCHCGLAGGHPGPHNWWPTLPETLPLGEPAMHIHDGLGLHRAETHHRPEDYR